MVAVPLSKVIIDTLMISKLTSKTVNLIITVVTNFYDYLYHNDELLSDNTNKLMEQIYARNGKRYKEFLHHITKCNPVIKDLLKVNEPTRRLKMLMKEQVTQLGQGTSNIRDEFLRHILSETELSLSEILSLHIGDFKRDYRTGCHIQLANGEELENGDKLKNNERKIEISFDLMKLYDDYVYYVLDKLEIDTKLLFVKLKGANKGEPLKCADVYPTDEEIQNEWERLSKYFNDRKLTRINS